MNKENILELQRIDCNCNDCAFLERDFEKTNKHRKSYEGTGLKPSLMYGKCKKFNMKQISFIPNICMIETQKCFIHRKDMFN